MSDTSNNSTVRVNSPRRVVARGKSASPRVSEFLTPGDASKLTNAAVLVVHFGQTPPIRSELPETRLGRLVLDEIVGVSTQDAAAKKVASEFLGRAKALRRGAAERRKKFTFSPKVYATLVGFASTQQRASIGTLVPGSQRRAAKRTTPAKKK